MTSDYPKPKYITGGCLCEALRYRIDFPKDHDFEKSSCTCQCTQCRRQTGSFFLPTHHVAHSAFKWTTTSGTNTNTDTTNTDSPSLLCRYQTTPTAERGFCTKCGSFMYWRRVASPDEPAPSSELYVAVGTIDPLFLFGEGREGDDGDGVEVPKEGFGRALCSGAGGHVWCGNEIPGVTDRNRMEYLHGRGQRFEKD